ncbi:MAG: PKD domain-containing protein [Bacteroidota bacterium]
MKRIKYLGLSLAFLAISLISKGQPTCLSSGGCYLMTNSTQTGVCEGTFKDSGGAGATGSYNYANNENLTMTFCAGSTDKMLFNFTTLDIKAGDHLVVHDGSSTSAPILYDFTLGSTNPGFIISSGTCLTFHFTSDAAMLALQNGNFAAEFKCVQAVNINDPGTVNSCGVIVTDPGGISGNYSSNANWTKTVCPTSPSECITVDFSNVNMESGVDKLEVYGGSVASGVPIATITGTTIPEAIRSNTDETCLTFKFTSNGSVNNAGFVAYLSCPASCPPRCKPNSPAAGDNCSNATPICDLNGYCGTTFKYDATTAPNGYTIDKPGNMTDGSGSALFTGSIDNNSWLKFVAGDVTATFNAHVGTCTDASSSKNIQIAVYDCSNCNNFVIKSDITLTQGSGVTFVPGTSYAVVTATNLIVGNVYYIMIDGVSGAECEYVIEAVSGIQMAASITPDQTICFGESATIDVTTSTNTALTWTTTPNDPSLVINGKSITVTPASAGTYEYSTHVTSVNGFCTYDTILKSKVIVLPMTDPHCQPGVTCDIMVAASPVSICSGEAVNLTSSGDIVATPQSQLSLSWSTNPVNSDPTLVSTATTGMSNLTNNKTVNPTATAWYVATITNGTVTCKDSVQVTVSTTLVANAGTDIATCPGVNSTLSASPANATSYSWTSNPAGFTSNVANPIVNPTATTTYIVTVNNNGCTGTDQVVVSMSPSLTVNAGNDLTTCPGVNTTLSASPANATSYSWTSNPAGFTSSIANPVVNPTATTTYIVSVNNNGCSGSDQIVINMASSLTVNAGSDVSICPGSNSQLNASPANATSYSWISNPAGFTSNIANPLVTPTATTTYSVSVNNNGCSGLDDVIVTIRNLPTISAGSDVSICAGTQTILTASNGSTYKWSYNNMQTPSITVNPSVESSYTVTGTDSYGCSNIDQVIVFMNPPANINAGNDVSICKSTSTQLNAQGGSSYNWTSTPASVVANIANPIVSPTVTTTYCVTGTDFQGCVGSDCIVVFVNNASVVSAGADQSICPYESAVLTASNASSFTWSPNGETSQSITVHPTATSTYCVTGIDANGCSASDCVTVNIKTLPIASAGPDISICNNSTTQLSASGGSPYNWASNFSGTVSQMSNPTVSPTITTTYTLTATNTQGCTASDEMIVFVNALPIVDAGSNQIICVDNCVNLTGVNNTSIGNDTWKWFPANQNTQIINVCPTNTTNYTLSVTDGNGCTGTDIVSVTVNPHPVVNAGADISVCDGEPITLNASGAESYNWDNGVGAGNQLTLTQPVGITTYTVTGTDINGCPATDAVKITVNPIPTSTFSVNPNPICARSVAAITYTGTASSVASYQWNFGGANYSTGAGSGPYQTSWDVSGMINVCLMVTQYGCTSTPTCVPVEVYPLPAIVFSSDKIEGCQPLSVVFADNSSPSPVSWSWNFGDDNSSDNTSALQNPSHVFEEPGLYSVRLTATSDKGCSNSMLFQDMITVYKNPVAEFYNLPEVGSYENNTISFFPSGSSTNVVAWEWDFGDYNANSSNSNSSTEEKPEHKYIEIGNYTTTLIVSTEHGCKDTISKNVFLREEFGFYIPNAFTPNNDGKNETWGPKGVGVDPDNFQMSIFNRWGELVYKTNDIEKQWDGRYAGSDNICQEGVYNWIINVKEKDGVVHKYVGHLTLIK